jgi:hypothetical protein
LQIGPALERYTPLRVDIAQSVIRKLAQGLQCESAEGQSSHDLSIALDGDHVTFHPSDPLLTKYGFSGVPYRIPSNVVDICHVVSAATRYYHYLRRSSEQRVLGKKVHVEFTRVNPLEDEYDDDLNQLYQAEGENLNHDGVIDIVVEKDALYGMKIVNDWNKPIYLAIFYFDQSDFSISVYLNSNTQSSLLLITFIDFLESWYRAPSKETADQDPPLLPKGSLTIGYGSGGEPPHKFFLREGQDIDINFLKIFLSTKPTDLPNASQLSPFQKGRGACDVVSDTGGFQDSKDITLVLRRKPAA